eukprot:TRINITY_DN2466_c0_g1_i1.p1 TRINITY_DN2466_c0_g1~~TRINITY_DN2466_c0_g1_i1.p1  ORF type:complete len:385 (-),score=90.37 TRINITY_DN2466_c0_g1_i1:136-1290(-)
MNLIDVGVLVLVAVIWGSQFLVVNIALNSFSPTLLMIGRLVVAIPCLSLITIINYKRDDKFASQLHECFRSPQATKLTVLQVAIVGILYHGIGSSTLAYIGTRIPSGIMSIVYSTEPVVAALAAFLHKLPNSKLDLWGIAGMFLAILGTTAVVFPSLTSDEGDSKEVSLLHIIATIVSPIAYGYGAIVNKILMTKQPVPVIFAVLGQCVFGVISLTLLWLTNPGETRSVGEEVANATLMAWTCVLIMGIVCVVMCWVLFTWLLERIGAQAALQAFLSPCIALLLGAAFNGEWDGQSVLQIVLQIAGVGVVFIGLGLIMKKDIKLCSRSSVGDDTSPVIHAAVRHISAQSIAADVDEDMLAGKSARIEMWRAASVDGSMSSIDDN